MSSGGESVGTVAVSVVVPCHNETNGVATLARELRPVLDTLSVRGVTELILVDDGSTDGTGAALEAAFSPSGNWSVSMLRHARNRGLGAALASGFEAARGAVVCCIDADCTYAPAVLLDLLAHMTWTQADVVVASPYHPEGRSEGVAAWRIRVSRAASGLYRLVARERLYCYTSMCRAYRRPFARPDWIRSPGFLGVTEVLVQALENGAKVAEFPVTLKWRDTGRSKMRFFRTACQHLRLLARLAVARVHARFQREPETSGSPVEKPACSLNPYSSGTNRR